MSRLSARFDVAYSGFRLDVALDVPARGVTVVYGPSGSGKTTLLRCLAGFERSPEGFMQLGEEVWQDESQQRFIPVHHRPIGLVFQEPRLFPHMNVMSNLIYGFDRTPGNQRNVFPDQVIDLLGLSPLLARRPHHLSGGEAQRVGIGRALLTSPRLLLMDEPLASLDAALKREILPFLRRLRAQLDIPIVYVSHSLNEVLQLVDTMVLLEAGRIRSCGPVDEVFSHLELSRVIDPENVGAVLDTTVAGHEPEYGLTVLDCMGQTLHVPKQDAPKGQSLRLHIHARDVSIGIVPPNNQTSILNILEATVSEIGVEDETKYSVDIKLDVGRPLLATITRKSLQRLNLAPGQKVYAHIKAIRMVHELEDL